MLVCLEEGTSFFGFALLMEDIGQVFDGTIEFFSILNGNSVKFFGFDQILFNDVGTFGFSIGSIASWN